MTALRTTQSAVPKPAASVPRPAPRFGRCAHFAIWLPLGDFGWTRGAARGWVFLAAFGVFGCGTATPPSNDPSPVVTASPGANDPSWLTSRENLPAPDTDRIEYDAQTRTLTFAYLSGRDRWMVQLPDEASGRQVGPQHRLPEGVDLNRTLVYYARPGSKMSAAVTVAQIAAGRAAHNSVLALHGP